VNNMNWADVLVFIFSILIILTVATQQAQDSVQDAFSGEKSDLFKDQKTRGFELFLMRSAFVFSLVFVAFVFVSLFLHK
jgi:preprotein translocase subunit SecG